MKKKFILLALVLLVSLLAARMPLAQEGDFTGPISSSSIISGSKEKNGILVPDLQVANYWTEPGAAGHKDLVALLCNTKCRVSIETFFLSPYRGIQGFDAIYHIHTDQGRHIAAYDRDPCLVEINGTFYRVDKTFFPQLEEILSTLPKLS